MPETTGGMEMPEMTFQASDIGMSYEMAATWPLFVLPALLIMAAILLFLVPRRIFVRIFSAMTASSGVLLVVLFFLPWLGVQCSGTEMQTATGYELAAGKTSLSDEMPSQMRQMMEVPDQAQADGDAPGLHLEGTAEATLDKDHMGGDDPAPKPWVYAGLALAAVLGLLGVTTLIRPSTRRATGGLSVVLGLAGCTLMIYVAFIQSFDGWIQPEPPEPVEMPTMPMPAPVPVVAADSDAGGVLEFRVAPYRPEAGRMENTISQGQRDEYLAFLQEQGPGDVHNQYLPDYVWIKTRGDESYASLVTADYDGETYLMLHNRDEYVMLHDPTPIGWRLTSVTEGVSADDIPAVDFRLDSRGARRMAELTGANEGDYMAIIVDGEICSAPMIDEVIRDEGQITTDDEAETAELLATLERGLRPEPVDNPFEAVGEQLAEGMMGSMMTSMPGAIMKNIGVRTKWPLFASLALYVLAVGCGVLMQFKGRGIPASLVPVAAPSTAAPAPFHPGAPAAPDANADSSA